MSYLINGQTRVLRAFFSQIAQKTNLVWANAGEHISQKTAATPLSGVL